MTLVTVTCIQCGTEYTLEMTTTQHKLLTGPRYARPKIQDLFPTYTADQRELLLSQICGSCYDEIFPIEFVDDEGDVY